MTSSLVQIRNLTKHFPIRKGFFNKQVGAVKALTSVNLDIIEGETLGLVGESGCGKSTLGRVMLRLMNATTGEVTFEGKEIMGLDARAMKPLRRQMQIVFQNPYASLDPRMTIEQILAEPLVVHGVASGKKLREETEKLIELVGLRKEMLDRYPHEFSGGQRQRIGIARALALRPKLIVADEPVSALDVSVQAQILNLLQDLKKEFSLTYLFIAHNLDVVRYISDRIAVMYLGRIVELGPCDEVYQKPLHPYSRALISAAPVPDPDFDRSNRIILTGDLPSPANPPSGCAFHTRCPIARDICRKDLPALREITPGHFSACHFAEELLNGAIKPEQGANEV
ncbi:MAG: dipeptide ABC transporter ATP-binding protein [Candidatus Obscuribacter sp.]|nr:dipeptide ABC transporter ATP-binding protein [Candidatus Obscuribacter sp.]MBP6350346.1 dipeptide ABC transporter ATP-binding protein [Candidatus Obscuribacter sp.]